MMSGFDREMQKALEADAEKLRALTGEEYGQIFLDDDYNCGNCGGEENRRLLETLERIAKGDTTTFDEELQTDVEVSADAEELSEWARSALTSEQPVDGGKQGEA